MFTCACLHACVYMRVCLPIIVEFVYDTVFPDLLKSKLPNFTLPVRCSVYSEVVYNDGNVVTGKLYVELDAVGSVLFSLCVCVRVYVWVWVWVWVCVFVYLGMCDCVCVYTIYVY